MLVRAANAGSKITEGKVKELTLVDNGYVEALKSLYDVRVMALKAESWWRAAQHKSDLLKMLGYKQNNEIKRGN